MLKEILAMSGKPGLFKLVAHGKNSLIVESLLNGRRIPAYARDRVMSLGDISVYTIEDDIPLAKVLETLKTKNEGKPIDLKTIGTEAENLRKYFTEIVPNFDNDRVYPTDIKKIISWYNLLLEKGLTDFSQEKESEETSQEKENK